MTGGEISRSTETGRYQLNGDLANRTFAIRVEHEQLRITRYLWVKGKKCLVLILGTHVDFYIHTARSWVSTTSALWESASSFGRTWSIDNSIRRAYDFDRVPFLWL